MSSKLPDCYVSDSKEMLRTCLAELGNLHSAETLASFSRVEQRLCSFKLVEREPRFRQDWATIHNNYKRILGHSRGTASTFSGNMKVYQLTTQTLTDSTTNISSGSRSQIASSIIEACAASLREARRISEEFAGIQHAVESFGQSLAYAVGSGPDQQICDVVKADLINPMKEGLIRQAFSALLSFWLRNAWSIIAMACTGVQATLESAEAFLDVPDAFKMVINDTLDNFDAVSTALKAYAASIPTEGV